MKNVELLHCVFGRSSQEIENHVKLRVSCFLIGWFSQSLRIQWETFVCFCLRSKKHPKKTMTDEGRTERIELFSYFMAHFKSLGEKINMVASRKLRTTVMQSRGYTLIVLVAALRCRNYRRNRRVLFVYHFLKSKFRFKAKLGGVSWLVCSAAG